MRAANSNLPPAAPGSSFYPVMGEWHDGTALFVIRVSYGGYYVCWKPERHQDALAAFKRLRIRPRHMELSSITDGGQKWSASVTWKAGEKLYPLAVIEALLD